MNEKIHAKGWRVDDRGYCIAITGYGRATVHGEGSDDAMICTLNNFLYGARKNAALIAAAPELYEMLRRIASQDRLLDGLWDMRADRLLKESVNELLKKAGGEEK